MMKSPLIARAAGALILIAVIAGHPSLAADVRDEFRQALDRAEHGDVDAARDSPALRAYVLYPDLQAARLNSAVDTAPDEALDGRVAAFLSDWNRLPAARDLRRDWLMSLADRGRWSEYLQQYRDDDQDPALVCNAFQARIASGEATASLGPALREFWITAPQMPQSCSAPFQWLKDQGLLTPPVIEQRARKALSDRNSELASWLLRMLPDHGSAELNGQLRLLQHPTQELEALAQHPGEPVDWSALLAAFQRQAARDPDKAQALLSRFEPRKLSHDQRAQLQRAVALGLAWDRRAEAVDWFRRLPTSATDESVHEWRIRAALWSGQIETAERWLQQLPPTLASEDRWVYWHARMLEALGRKRQSEHIYQELADKNGYYSVLAAWRLGKPYTPHDRGLADDPDMRAQLLERPGFVRARELHIAACDIWANREWRRATDGLDADQRLAAARLASSWGWHIQAVSMLSSADALDALEISYPDPFNAPIRDSAVAAEVPPAWVYGLMRQESLFNPRAASPSNAYGLLQLLLPTAKHVARRLGVPAPKVEDLMRPEVNIPLGAQYLGEIRKRFDGQFVPSVAAYNAGPNAVQRWLPGKPMDADFWIENVPYDQTRHYVEKVLWHIAVHRWQSSGEPQDVGPLLAPVRVPES